MIHCDTSDDDFLYWLDPEATKYGRLIGLELAPICGETINHKPSMALLCYGKGFTQRLR